MGKISKVGLAAPDDPIFSEGVQMFSTRRPPSDEAKPSIEASPEVLKEFKKRSKKHAQAFLDSLNKAALEDNRSDKGES